MNHAPAGGRLLSVLQHLARSHGANTSLQERCGILQASLHLVAAELSIKRLATELLRHCKYKALAEVLLFGAELEYVHSAARKNDLSQQKQKEFLISRICLP